MCRNQGDSVGLSGFVSHLFLLANKRHTINLLGTVNVSVLGIVGYLAYTNWKRPSWDKRVVSATSAGLIALWGTEMLVFATLRYSILISHYSALASSDDVRQYFPPKS